MFERFDDAAKAAVHEAELAANGLGHNFLGTEHLLLGVLADPATETSVLLASHGVDRAQVRAGILNVTGSGPGPRPSPDELLAALGIDSAEIRRRSVKTFGTDAIRRAALQARPRRRGRGKRLCQTAPCSSVLEDSRSTPFCPRAKHALELAARRADAGGRLVTPTHLLAGMLLVPKAMGPRVLVDLGVNVDALLAAADAALDRPGA